MFHIVFCIPHILNGCRIKKNFALLPFLFTVCRTNNLGIGRKLPQKSSSSSMSASPRLEQQRLRPLLHEQQLRRPQGYARSIYACNPISNIIVANTCARSLCKIVGKSGVNAPSSRQLVESQAWAPSFKNAFRLIFAIRCAAALYSIISDCDEVFNYWEPTHWLQYGYGLQTWEYSPEFAIRSWSYVSVHAILGWIGSWFAKSKVS